MEIIGENIHIISKDIRNAVDNREKGYIQDLAKKQVESGAKYIDLNIGPRKKDGVEVMQWMVETVLEVVKPPVGICLDTTNAAAIEAGLKMLPKDPKPIINSTNANPERMQVLMPLAAEHDAYLICLTLRATGLPATADERADIAASDLMMAAMEYGLPMENIIFDPLAMTVNGTQSHGPEVVKACQVMKQLNDPPFLTTCGLSNVSNSCPEEVRPILNRVYAAMLAGAGMDWPITDAFDPELRKVINVINNRDESTELNKLYLALFDAVVDGSFEEFDFSIVNQSDPDQVAVMKTAKVLMNQTLYAHGFLNL